MSDAIPRGWAPYATVAKERFGISPDVLRGAIERGELAAYEKPVTRGRKASAERPHRMLWVSVADADEWVRANWHRYEGRGA